MHTRHSDWAIHVPEIYDILRDLWIGYFAITDHDSTWGVSEAEKVLSSKREGPKLVSWIEITTHYKEKTLHLLAYGFAPENSDLDSFLMNQRIARRKRAEEIVRLLNLDLEKEGLMPIPLDVVLALEVEWPITRPDIAKYLIKIGYVKDFREAFDRWLKNYEVPLDTKNISQTIELIRDIRWVAVLAHAFAPYVSLNTLTQNIVEQSRILTELKTAWLQWVEVYYSGYEHDQDFLKKVQMADWLDLLVTGGSDFHGGWKTGTLLPWVSIPKERLEKFLSNVYR